MLRHRCLLPLLLFLPGLAMVPQALAQQQARLSESVSPDNELTLAIQPDFHLRYGCFYPITYRIQIPAGSAGLTVERRRSCLAAWDTLPEMHAGDLFNGIEAVRFDYAGNHAHVSAAFAADSDSLMLRVTDSTDTAAGIVFEAIDKYYDGRRAVVTVSADDWCDHETARFCKTLDVFRSYGLCVTGGIITGPDWCSASTWSDIQREADLGNLEVASHSRSHVHTPYQDPPGEVEGSADDIVSHVQLPALFSSNARQYVYVWLAPFGSYDATVDSLVGDRGYVIPRLYYQAGQVTFSDWDAERMHFGTIQPTAEIAMPSWGGGSTDSTAMNSTFDDAVAVGQIYHLMWHPQVLSFDLGEPYVASHLAHISGHSDLWYTYLGQLYLYHMIEQANRSVLTTLTVPETGGRAFQLRQNFPNPFRSRTTIQFEVAERANVSLRVFDVLGERVATLAEGAMAPGRHVVSWDARKVPSGTYFCQLAVSAASGNGGMISSTRKMMRIR